MAGDLVPTTAGGRPQHVPLNIVPSLVSAFANVNCVTEGALASGLPVEKLTYRVAGRPSLTKDKARVAGSVPAVKDALLHYNGSRIRGRRLAAGPAAAVADPEIVLLD